jgi:hypothetical protein
MEHHNFGERDKVLTPQEKNAFQPLEMEGNFEVLL